MGLLRDITSKIGRAGEDREFLGFIKMIENLVSKVLSLAMVFVILIALGDLIIFLFRNVTTEPIGFFNVALIELFGLFLNILIALELLENITAYLRKHVIQVELVIVTSLIAVARKIIILDLEKVDGTELIGLSLAILALSISFLIVKFLNTKLHDE